MSYTDNDTSSSSENGVESEIDPITMTTTSQIARGPSFVFYFPFIGHWYDTIVWGYIVQEEDDAPTKWSTGLKRGLSKIQNDWYPSFLLDHLDKESFKVTSRTWIHTWFTVLIIAIAPVMNWEGSAAYFGTIIALISPAGGSPISHTIVDIVLMVLMAVIGYTGSIIVMATNYRIRGYPQAADVAKAIFMSGECKVGDSACVSLAMLDGRFVNSKTNAVMAFGYILTNLALLAFDVYPPMAVFFRVPVIIGLIFTSINMINANHIPFFIPWKIAKNLFLPMFVTLGARLLLAVVWFPTTAAATVVAQLTGQFTINANNMDSMLSKASKTKMGSSEQDDLASQFGSSFHASPVFWIFVGSDMPLLKYEPTYSRLDPDDISEYSIFVQRLAFVNSALTFYFQEFVNYRKTIIENVEKRKNSTVEKESNQSEDTDNIARSTGVHPLQELSTSKPTFGKPMRHRLHRPWLKKKLNKEYMESGAFEKSFADSMKNHKYTFSDVSAADAIFTLIFEYYAPKLHCANKAIGLIARWLEEANSFRSTALVVPKYRKRRIQVQRELARDMKDMLVELENVYVEIKQSPDWIEKALKQDREQQFNEQQTLYAISQDIFMGFLAEQSISLSRNICRWCVFLDDTRPGAVFSWPFRRGNTSCKRADVLKHHEPNRVTESGIPEVYNNNSQDSNNLYKPVKTTERRNPNSTPPRNVFHLVGTHMLKIHNAIMGENGTFLIKKAAVGLIPTVLYMVRPTLEFAFGYRIVWVSVMATLTASPRAGDCVYSLFVRFVMTLFGGLCGMICWYISTGRGEGNPYGLAAVGAVSLFFMSYFRHYSTVGGPGPAPRIVFAITWVLVLCMSYLDHKIQSPGLKIRDGYEVFWIRLVSVAAGLLIGFLATIFPRAHTTKLTVRRQISNLIKSVGDTQAALVNLALQRYDNSDVHQALYNDAIIAKLNSSARGYSMLKMNMAILVFEPPLTGFWPVNNYNLLTKMINEVLYIQAIFYTLLNGVPEPDDSLKCLEIMGMLDSDLLAGLYSLIYMSSNSIEFGEPLPTITPGHLTKDHRLALLRQVKTTEYDCAEDFLRAMSKTRSGRALITSGYCSELFFRRMDSILALVKNLCGEVFDFDSRVNEYAHHNF